MVYFRCSEGNERKKPPGDADGGKEKTMNEYKVEYDGRTYEFPTWSEMKEFIEDHGIHG